MLAKHISRKSECRFDGRKLNLNQRWNNDRYVWECKKLKEHNVCKKCYFCNPFTCNCENGTYVGSITENLVIACDEILDSAKAIPTSNTLTKTVPIKSTSTNFCMSLTILLFTIALLIGVSICYYLVNDKAKQKHLPFLVTNNELKEVLY